jgi:hypothetical protein
LRASTPPAVKGDDDTVEYPRSERPFLLDA